MKERNLLSVVITDKAKKSLTGGHPWVYGNEIIEQESGINDGDLVDVFSTKGKYQGTGFYNSKSKITVRVISKNANDRFDDAFFKRRLEHAYQYRKTVMGKDITNCRLIFGEADFFPGLTIDRFNNLLVVESLCLGIEKRIDLILTSLVEILRKDNQVIEGIYLRNESPIRNLEGMECFKGWYKSGLFDHEVSPVTTIVENNIIYKVDTENGQKTGFFLDQKYNRALVGRLCEGKTVLDCFTHTGSFGLNAAYCGANKVVSVDISDTALETAKENCKANHLEHIVEYRQGDVFEVLKSEMKKPSYKYDFIILDPPAFTKSRDTIRNASEGYKQINMMAMKMLPKGGYLATCSCSHFMNDGLFKTMIHQAAEEANVQLRQIAATQQGPDHPILWNVPETNYLKFYVFQIV